MARDTSDIDERAKRVFESELSDHWIPTQEVPDKQHLDYRVHIREGGKPSGLEFAVQLKGVDRPRVTKNGLAKSFRKKHLEFWIDRCRQPVFLILVDTTREEAYFRFIHDWNRERGDSWRENKVSSIVHFSRDNRVSDDDRFYAAVTAADLGMRRLRPGPFPDAARVEIERLRSIDDRFDYHLSFHGHTQRVTANPHDTVLGGFELRGQDALEKFRRMRSTGEPVDYDPGEIRLSGGGIFDEMSQVAARQKVTLQTEASLDCEVGIDTENDSRGRRSALPLLRGTMRGGTERRRFECRLGDTPVGIRGEIAFIRQGPGVQIEAEYRLLLNLDSWANQPILCLPGFVEVERFLLELGAADNTFVILRLTDQLAVEGTLEPDRVQAIVENVGPRMALVSSLRSAASTLEVSPPLPDFGTLPQEDLAALGLLCSVAEAGQLVVPMPVGRCDVTIPLPVGGASQAATAIREAPYLVVQAVRPASLLDAESTSWLIGSAIGPLQLTTGSAAELESVDPASTTLRVQAETQSETVFRYDLIPRAEFDGPIPLPPSLVWPD